MHHFLTETFSIPEVSADSAPPPCLEWDEETNECLEWGDYTEDRDLGPEWIYGGGLAVLVFIGALGLYFIRKHGV